MEKLKERAIRIKDHVKRNQVAYGLGMTTIGLFWLVQRNQKTFNEFLTEKGIDLEEFYNPESFAQNQIG